MKKLIALVLTLAMLATACGSSVFSLTVGDCFNDPESAEEVSRVETVGCDKPHDNEVYATFDVTDVNFPGEAAIQAQAEAGCIARFGPYVGSDFQISSLNASFLTPTEASWENDDREIVCFLFDLELTKLVASAKGSGI